jgi:hypothetical protein
VGPILVTPRAKGFTCKVKADATGFAGIGLGSPNPVLVRKKKKWNLVDYLKAPNPKSDS